MEREKKEHISIGGEKEEKKDIFAGRPWKFLQNRKKKGIKIHQKNRKKKKGRFVT